MPAIGHRRVAIAAFEGCKLVVEDTLGIVNGSQPVKHEMVPETVPVAAKRLLQLGLDQRIMFLQQIKRVAAAEPFDCFDDLKIIVEHHFIAVAVDKGDCRRALREVPDARQRLIAHPIENAHEQILMHIRLWDEFQSQVELFDEQVVRNPSIIRIGIRMQSVACALGLTLVKTDGGGGEVVGEDSRLAAGR